MNLLKRKRVHYIIENHHSPSKAYNIDFQIQWEADLLAIFINLLQYFLNCSKIVCDVINKHISSHIIHHSLTAKC